ncbi:MAG: hypothetical protein O7E52_24885 [Candidatus Poribacteria bacterium]|nr:hypothetical protein [Candidatus Poribacteria bacterium]
MSHKNVHKRCLTLNRYTLLARANGGDEAAMLLFRFQRGLYIVTSLKNEIASDLQINQAIMENLLHFSVNWLDQKKGIFQRGPISR